MKQYLAILNRYEFAQFYRFGYMFIANAELLPFEDINSDKTKNDVIKFFSETTPFEYDEEYLIINLTYNNEIESPKNLFYVQDIKAIYPLSRQAKLSIQDRIDTRIKLEEPIFESILPQIISNIENKEIELAITGLWNICGFTESFDELRNKIGLQNIEKGIEYRRKGIFASQIVDGNLWSILLAYERYEPYSKSVLGYFFDAGQIFAFSKNRPTFEGSQLHGFLKSLDNNLQTLKIINSLERSEAASPYIQNTNIDGFKFYVIAPLFLMIKDDFRKHDNIKNGKFLIKENLEYLKKTFGNDFKIVLILLGSFFGFKKIYDAYYDSLNLRFYNSILIKKPSDIIEKNISETVNSNKDSFELSSYIANILKQQNEISLTDLGKKLKSEKNIKFSNPELEEKIKGISDFELTKTKPKKIKLKQNKADSAQMSIA